MENYLQITDHWVTIVSGIFTSILALVAIWLAWRTFILTKSDKQKTIAINELQLQTKKLEELYLLQIQPRFVANHHSGEYIKITNIGGDCYNLQISVVEETTGKYGNPFEKWGNFFSSKTEKTVNYKTYGENNFKFVFEDKFGNEFEQILYTLKRRFSNIV